VTSWRPLSPPPPPRASRYERSCEHKQLVSSPPFVLDLFIKAGVAARGPVISSEDLSEEGRPVNNRERGRERVSAHGYNLLRTTFSIRSTGLASVYRDPSWIYWSYLRLRFLPRRIHGKRISLISSIVFENPGVLSPCCIRSLR